MQLQRIRPFTGSRPTARPVQPRVHGGAIHRVDRCRTVIVQANEKVPGQLVKAKERYEAGDRMTALNLYEDVLKQDPTPEQKQAAMFGMTAVHAAFGDVELAQMTLRDAIRAGLDYEKALEDPTNVRMQTSQQITIQLRRFSQQITIAMNNRLPSERPYGKGSGASSGLSSASRRPGQGKGMGVGGNDLDSILGSSKGDTAEVDTSVGAIIRRVALVVLLGVGLGVGLFFFGLEYAFPKGF